MSRIREDYHRKLEKNYSAQIRKARKGIMRGGSVDVHDILGVGERGLRKIAVNDDYRRNSFLTHIYFDKKPWEEAPKGRGGSGGFLKGGYDTRTENDGESVTCVFSKRSGLFCGGSPVELEVTKKFTVGPDPEVIFTHQVLRHSGRAVLLRYAVEFNFLIWDRAVMARPVFVKTDRFKLRDRYSGIGLDLFFDKRFTIFGYPVYTVNETERGLKKTFQGVSVLIGDEYGPADSGARRDMRITVRVTT